MTVRLSSITLSLRLHTSLYSKPKDAATTSIVGCGSSSRNAECMPLSNHDRHRRILDFERLGRTARKEMLLSPPSLDEATMTVLHSARGKV